LDFEILIPEEKIKKRVKELAEEISNEFGNSLVTIVSILKGAVVFTVDLMKYMKSEVEIDFIRIKSYQGEKKGELRMTVLPELDLKGKQVLIVDDIFDTGESLKLAYDEVIKHFPEVVKTCVFLDKQIEKKVDIRPDFVGFEIPDYFVVGYGLDINEMYRDLPYIGYFKRGE
jgi:hypoxanthine phosphoribosyltransferase